MKICERSLICFLAAMLAMIVAMLAMMLPNQIPHSAFNIHRQLRGDNW